MKPALQIASIRLRLLRANFELRIPNLDLNAKREAPYSNLSLSPMPLFADDLGD